MIRIVCLLLLLATPAWPQTPVTTAEADRVLAVLKDDAKRTEFVATLEAIAHALPASAAGKLALPPDSLGAELLVGASETLSDLTSGVVDTVRTVTDFPLIWRFLTHLATDPVTQAELAAAAWKLAVVLGAGLVAARLVAMLARRSRLSLAARVPAGRSWAKLWLSLGLLGLDLAPVLAMAAVGYGLLGTGLGEEHISRLVILAVLDGYVICRVLTGVVRIVVAPGAPRLRLLPVSDAAAAGILTWTRRIAVVAVFGTALAEIGLLFGLYRVAHDALLKLVGLAVHAMAAVIVLRHRAAISALIRPHGAAGAMAVLRARLADVWLPLALFFIAASWVVLAFEVPHGFAHLFRLAALTLAVLGLGRLVWLGTHRVLDGALRGTAPSMLRRHQILIRLSAQAALIVATLLVLFQAWGLDSLSWFEGGALGGRLLGAIGSIGLTAVLALVVWEAANAGVNRHLDRLAAQGQLSRSARLRTLLPMLRTALFAVIAVFTALMALSEIGVNIAPLLAGAGVLGIAIGFGSQKLVQDIITGLFLLLENTMQVGDVVSLGGLSGSVENLSVRTIRLRALDGSVHIVPFSAVTTVTNMTRDYGYALLDVAVGLNEPDEKVVGIVGDVARAMRLDPAWKEAVRDDLEVLGVERFIDNAWVLRVRLKTLPAQRWAVSRELNRRIKARFDALAVESPFTSFRALGTVPVLTTLPHAPAETAGVQPVG